MSNLELKIKEETKINTEMSFILLQKGRGVAWDGSDDLYYIKDKIIRGRGKLGKVW